MPRRLTRQRPLNEVPHGADAAVVAAAVTHAMPDNDRQCAVESFGCARTDHKAEHSRGQRSLPKHSYAAERVPLRGSDRERLLPASLLACARDPEIPLFYFIRPAPARHLASCSCATKEEAVWSASLAFFFCYKTLSIACV